VSDFNLNPMALNEFDAESQSMLKWHISTKVARLLIFLADMRFLRLTRKGDASALGPLESRVMEALWNATSAVSVADVLTVLSKRKPVLSYSTVKAVLSNLTLKGHVKKRSIGRSNVFTPATTKAAFQKNLVSQVIDSLIHSYREPVLAHLVDELTSDDSMLDDLERLIAEKRLAKGGSQ
jgi:BlaI family transcriptional regulator, penicillinase repressor